MNLYADTIAPVRRTKGDELFLIRMVAKPLPQNPEVAEVGGAYANCWVDADKLSAAEATAIERIVSEQWQPTKFDHWEIVSRRSYIEDTNRDGKERQELLKRVDEAFEIGVSMTLDCW